MRAPDGVGRILHPTTCKLTLPSPDCFYDSLTECPAVPTRVNYVQYVEYLCFVFTDFFSLSLSEEKKR